MEEKKDRNEVITNAVRDVTIMALLVVGAVTLALTDHGELAATALGGALAYAVPGVRRPGPVPPQVVAIAFGLGLGALASGCGAAPAIANAWAVAKPVTCAGARLYTRLVCGLPDEEPAREPDGGGEDP